MHVPFPVGSTRPMPGVQSPSLGGLKVVLGPGFCASPTRTPLKGQPVHNFQRTHESIKVVVGVLTP